MKKTKMETKPANIWESKLTIGVLICVLLSSIVVVYYSLIYKPKETSCDISHDQSAILSEKLNGLTRQNKDLEDQIAKLSDPDFETYMQLIDTEIINLRSNIGRVLIVNGIRAVRATLEIETQLNSPYENSVTCFDQNGDNSINIKTLLMENYSNENDHAVYVVLSINKGKSNEKIIMSNPISLSTFKQFYNSDLPGHVVITCAWTLDKVIWSVYGFLFDDKQNTFPWIRNQLIETQLKGIISIDVSQHVASTFQIRTLKDMTPINSLFN